MGLSTGISAYAHSAITLACCFAHSFVRNYPDSDTFDKTYTHKRACEAITFTVFAEALTKLLQIKYECISFHQRNISVVSISTSKATHTRAQMRFMLRFEEGKVHFDQNCERRDHRSVHSTRSLCYKYV